MPPNDYAQFSDELGGKLDCNGNELPKDSTQLFYSRNAYTRSHYDPNPCAEAPLLTRICVQFCHSILLLMGLLAETLRYYRWIGSHRAQERKEQQDFAPLGNHFESVFMNGIYRYASDTLNRPICGVPTTTVTVKERYSDDFGWTYQFTAPTIIWASHNSMVPVLMRPPEPSIRTDCKPVPWAMNRFFPLQRKLEDEVCQFLGTEDALCFPNGFGINTMVIPRISDEKTLVLSDELMHASVIIGLRTSKAKVIIFRHNDTDDLETKLRNALVEQLAWKRRDFNKILIVVEGIYSMEGTIVNLPRLLEIKEKYRCYLFIDEAHSIGAIGATGRGVTEYWECNPCDVDLLMGTFTKSFGSAGGYITGRKALIERLRNNVAGALYAPPMSPPLIAQVIASMKLMSCTSVGREKNLRLLENTRYFRRRLEEMGFIVYGHRDTAIISVLTFYMPKAALFGREALKRDLAVCVVGYPATPMNKPRVRFCISSEHTREQMDRALEIADIAGELANIKYKKRSRPSLSA